MGGVLITLYSLRNVAVSIDLGALPSDVKIAARHVCSALTEVSD